MRKQSFLTVVLSLLISLDGFCQLADTSWEKLKPFFSCPGDYEGKYGNYRNPLEFYDGRKVKDKNDWKKRRAEILDRWHGMMGRWPALVAHPAYEILTSLHRDNFTQYSIRFKWRPDETTDGYLLIPDDTSTKKRPAVVSVFYEAETGIGLKRPFIDFAYQLAKRGFITLSVGASPVAKEKPYAQYYPDFDHATVQPLSMLAYLAANCWNLLAIRPEVDSTRIGIVGLSYGSKWAMFASCLYEKYSCAVWSDGGIVFDNKRPNINYQDPWYLGYYLPPWSEDTTANQPAKGLYPRLMREGYDLTDLHALMAPRPFLVSGGSEDSPERWIALNQTVRINKLLGYENRIGMTNRKEHIPDAAANEKVWEFFDHFLKNQKSAIR